MARDLCWVCGNEWIVARMPGGAGACRAHLIYSAQHISSLRLMPHTPVTMFKQRGDGLRLPYGTDATLYGCHNCETHYYPGPMPSGWYYTGDGPLCPKCGQGQPSSYARRKA